VYRNNGYNAQRVSTHAVEWQIQQYNVLNDAIGYSYQQDGHSFYVLTFPTANATWVFDVSTGAWHERAAWDGVEFRRHRSNCQANYAGQVLVGDWESGNVYALDMTWHKDFVSEQRWLRSWRALPTGQNNLKRTAHHALQLDCEAGAPFQNESIVNWSTVSDGVLAAAVMTQPQRALWSERFNGRMIGDVTNDNILGSGDALEFFRYGAGTITNTTYIAYIRDVVTPILLNNPQKYKGYLAENPSLGDPQVMLRWSDDGGHTWSNEHWASMGKLGEYGKRVIWRRLGMTMKLRDRVYEISGSDPVKIAIMGAELTATPTSA